MQPRLVFLKGSEVQGVVELSDSVCRIGRDKDNDIQLLDNMISRFHCQIYADNGRYSVEDLQSSNGTCVNNVPITNHELEVGDEIRLGNVRILFTVKTSTNRKSEKQHQTVVLSTETPVTSQVVFLPRTADGAELVESSLMKRKSKETTALRNLLTIYQIGKAVHSAGDFSELLHTIMDVIFEVTKPDRGILVLLDEQCNMVPKVIRKTDRDDTSEVELPLSHSIVNKVLTDKESVLTCDAMIDERFKMEDSVIAQHIRSAMCVPLAGKSKTVGLIYVDTLSKSHAFTKDDLRLLTAIGDQAGIAVENLLLFNDKKEMLLGSVKALVMSVEARDRYLRGHSERVSAIAVAVARTIGWQEKELEKVELAALLHDVGKIGTPEYILNKPGRLNVDEIKRSREHPVKGAEILGNIKGIEDIVMAVRHHHEHYNGHGYPDELSGEDIPVLSRIIGLADAFDAMTTDRPYRQAFTVDKTLGEIKQLAGVQFDASVVKAFFKAYEQGSLNGFTHYASSPSTKTRSDRPYVPPGLSSDSEDAEAPSLIEPTSAESLPTPE